MPRRVWILGLALALCFACGCGSDKEVGPKTTLNEQEKQQIKELNTQRQQEWGPRK